MKKGVVYGSILLNIAFVFGLFYLVKRLGGINFMLYRLQTNEVAGNYNHLKNQYDFLPIKEGDIVFLGNSLTANGNWHEFFDNNKVKNRGISGDVTEGILKRLSPITKGKPSKIFLMIGVNDLLFHSPTKALGFYQEIVDKIKSELPETELILQSLLPVNTEVKSMPIKNKDILQINEGIKAIATKEQLKFVDLHSKFLDSKGRLRAELTTDGIHLDIEGYLIWKNEIEHLVRD